MNLFIDRAAINAIATLTMIAILFAAFPQQVAAQVRINDDDLETLFVPAPRELTRALDKAQKLTDAGKFSDAITELTLVLGADSDEDYFIRSNRQKTYHSAQQEVARIIGSMPRAGLDVFEKRFGIRAAKLLELAVQNDDIDQIRSVSSNWFYTRAGYAATMLLGQYYLDNGESLSAAFSFQRVVDATEAREIYQPQAQLLLATAWNFAGESSRAEQALLELARQYPESKVTVGGKQVELFTNNTDALQWLNATVGAPAELAVESEDRWVMHRGNPQRTGQIRHGRPLLLPDWKTPVSRNHNVTQATNDLLKTFADESLSAVPGVNALALADCVVVRSTDKLIGIDFRTGKRVWMYPWEDEDPIGIAARSDTSGRPNSASATDPAIISQVVQQRLFADSVYGQLSSDGSNVYFVEGMGFNRDAIPYNRRLLRMRGRLAGVTAENKLVSLQLADDSDRPVQGKLRWLVGDKTGLDEPELAGAFFLGPPLPVQDAIYAICELKQELRMVALDSATGHLKWSQQLIAVDPSSGTNALSPRRMSGASPSFSEGVLVCPTSSGAVVAIDTLNRRLLWGFRYGGNSTAEIRRRVMRMADNAAPGSDWADATTTIVGSKVFVTPAVSNQIYCLDLFTGGSIWKQPVQRENDLYVAGVYEDTVVLVGTDSVRALRIGDGSQAWGFKLAEEAGENVGTVCGRGYLSADALFLPTSGSAMLEIDLANQKIAKVSQTLYPLGNLIAYQGSIISHGADWIASFPHDQVARAFVKKKLADHPDDLRALRLKCQLLMNESKYLEALDIVEEVVESNRDPETVELLFHSLQGSMRADFDQVAGRIGKLEPFIDDAEMLQQFLRIKILGQLKNRRSLAALQTMFQLDDLIGGQDKLADGKSADDDAAVETLAKQLSTAPEVSDDATDDGFAYETKYSWQQWLQTNFGLAIKQADEDELQKIERLVIDRIEQAANAESSASIRSLASALQQTPYADRVDLVLARRRLEAGDLLEAELLFRSLIADQPEQDAEKQADANSTANSTALAGLATVCLATDRKREAVRIFRELAERSTDKKVWGESTAEQLLESAIAVHSRVDPLDAKWNYGRVDVTPAEQSSQVNRMRTRVQMRTAESRFAEDLAVSINYDSENWIRIHDAAGQILAKLNLIKKGSESYGQYQSFHSPTMFRNGNLVVIMAGYRIAAIDLNRLKEKDDAAVIWRLESGPLKGRNTSGRLMVTVRPQLVRLPFGASDVYDTDSAAMRINIAACPNRHAFCFMEGDVLNAVDSLTGKILWRTQTNLIADHCASSADSLFVIGRTELKGKPKVVDQFDLLSGRHVDSFMLPVNDGIWRVRGSKVLLWQEDELRKMTRLSMYDLETSAMTWSEDMASESIANMIGDDRIAIVDPEYRLRVMQIETGRLLTETVLKDANEMAELFGVYERDAEIPGFEDDEDDTEQGEKDHKASPARFGYSALLVTEDRGNYFVGLDTNSGKLPSGRSRGRRTQSLGGGQLFNGLMYCVSRETGDLVWQSPMKVDSFGFPANQPAAAPALVFGKRVQTPQQDGGEPGRPQAVLFAVDKRDGRRVFSSRTSPLIESLKITVNPSDQSMRVRLANTSQQLRFTNKPTAPAPPLHQ